MTGHGFKNTRVSHKGWIIKKLGISFSYAPSIMSLWWSTVFLSPIVIVFGPKEIGKLIEEAREVNGCRPQVRHACVEVLHPWFLKCVLSTIPFFYLEWGLLKL